MKLNNISESVDSKLQFNFVDLVTRIKVLIQFRVGIWKQITEYKKVNDVKAQRGKNQGDRAFI